MPDSQPQRLAGGRPLEEPLPPLDVVWANAGVGSPLRLIRLSNPTRQPGRGIPLPVVGDGRGPRGGADSTRARSDREPGAATNAGGSPLRSASRISRGDSLRTSCVNGSDVSAPRRRSRPLPPPGSVHHPRRVRGRRVPRRVRGRRGSTRNRPPGVPSAEAASGWSRRSGPARGASHRGSQRLVPQGTSRRGSARHRVIWERDGTKVIRYSHRGSSAKHRTCIIPSAPFPPRVVVFFTSAKRIVDPLLCATRGTPNTPPNDGVDSGGVPPIWRLLIPLTESRGGCRRGRRRRGSSRRRRGSSGRRRRGSSRRGVGVEKCTPGSGRSSRRGRLSAAR